MPVRLLLFLIATFVAAPALSQTTDSTGRVRVISSEDEPYALNFRGRLHPAAIYVGTADTIGAYGAVEAEFSRRVALGVSGQVPYHNLTSAQKPRDYLQGEAWLRFNFRDELVHTQVRVTLDTTIRDRYETQTSVHWTQEETYVEIPATYRKFSGLRLGAQYLQIPAVLNDGCEGDCRWNSSRVAGFVGYHGGTQTNRSRTYEGYGTRSSRERLAYFVDLTVAPLTNYKEFRDFESSTEPPEIGWGARVGFELSLGAPAGAGIRTEFGSNPAAGGWYFLYSVGLDLNLSVGGGHTPP